jgi:hypothetical protein
LPDVKIIGVLPVSTSIRPKALLPQLGPIFEAGLEGKRIVVFVSRTNDKFQVETVELPNDVDSGDRVIDAFKSKMDAREIDLASVYPHYSNQQLGYVRQISDLMKLRGLQHD